MNHMLINLQDNQKQVRRMVVQCVKVYWKKLLLKHKVLVELLEIKLVLIHRIWNGITVKNVITILYISIKLINALFVQDVEFSQKMKSETVHIITQNNSLHKSYGVLVSECNYTTSSEIIYIFLHVRKLSNFLQVKIELSIEPDDS